MLTNTFEFSFLLKLPDWYNQVMFLVYAIAYTNSTLNPLLYGGLNQVTACAEHFPFWTAI